MNLCSECSRPILPVVAIDIDGTLSDYHESYISFASDYWNLRHPTRFYDGSVELEDHIGITKAQYREAKLAYRQGGMKRMQPILSGAAQMMNMLRRIGVEVWLTTTRPWMRHDSTDPDTRFWLEKYRIPFDHLLYDDDKYGRLQSIVGDRVMFVLEDLPEMYDRAEELWPGAPHMVIRPHNSAIRGQRRVCGAIQAPHVVSHRIQQKDMKERYINVTSPLL